MASNHLAGETSPYLLQHAHNPVDWYPWGKEAFAKARAEEKPIFLSVGYSACHWCHVMAHESFEDERVAAILNQNFVSIKVDREERPDVDQVYMTAVQSMSGSGGWPMSVFLTPGGQPFYGGTYFPPARRHGLPSFTDILMTVADAWRNRRDELIESGLALAQAIDRQAHTHGIGESTDLSTETLHAAAQTLEDEFDPTNGGWGHAPKFPQPMAIEYLLFYDYVAPPAGTTTTGEIVRKTLQAMARGGMYDQLGGGFHRYSTDAVWLAPHFEKMLYDNAQLARVYLHAWQATGEEFYRVICEETLDYVLREMTAPEGGFYSTQDADSEGVEGKYFVWTPDEITNVLGARADEFMRTYGVTTFGNFEGKNILSLRGSLNERSALAEARRTLLVVRERRVRPATDTKVLASWNGMMLAAFAEAARALGREDYRQAAERNARFLREQMRQADGRLWHSWREGRAKIDGFLEDYAWMAEGLLALYQTTFEQDWYEWARELADIMLMHFRAETGFYDTSDEQEALIVRPRDVQDNATPSGNAIAATVLLKLADFSGETRFRDVAEESLGQLQPLLGAHPLAFGQWLQALAYTLADPREVAIVGEPGAADTRALLAVCNAGYQPDQVVVLGPEGSNLPLLRDRPKVNGKATAYVCVRQACRAPVMEPESLRRELERGRNSTSGS